MNIHCVLRLFGLLTMVLSGSMLLVVVVTLTWFGTAEQEWASEKALLTAVVAGAAIGLSFWLAGRRGPTFLGRREAMLLVAISWLLGAALAGMPYRLWALFVTLPQEHPFESIVSCYFEAMSGLTTTGATVLTDIGSLPRGLLLWRAMTNWLGGLGIVVLFVAVLPTLGVGGKKLLQVETPGPTAQGVRPRIGETARTLWMIYVGLTAIEFTILCAWGGMRPYDAICHTFATLATGGFSIHNASVAHYDSVAIDITTIVFMAIAGVNFAIYDQMLRRNFRVVWKDSELRLYATILVVASVIVVAAIYRQPLLTTADEAIDRANLEQAVRHGVFQVVSIQTTTGFCTADFNLWGLVPKTVLLILMFIGASAGSTGGGIKVIRCLVALKVMFVERERIYRPHVVRTVRVGKWSVGPELCQATLAYVLGILLLFALGTIALLMLEHKSEFADFTTCATASAATLNNIGPGLAAVGATGNYAAFNAPSKLVLSLLMAMGRLEIFAITVLLSWSFWRG